MQSWLYMVGILSVTVNVVTDIYLSRPADHDALVQPPYPHGQLDAYSGGAAGACLVW